MFRGVKLLMTSQEYLILIHPAFEFYVIITINYKLLKSSLFLISAIYLCKKEYFKSVCFIYIFLPPKIIEIVFQKYIECP